MIRQCCDQVRGRSYSQHPLLCCGTSPCFPQFPLRSIFIQRFLQQRECWQGHRRWFCPYRSLVLDSSLASPLIYQPLGRDIECIQMNCRLDQMLSGFLSGHGVCGVRHQVELLNILGSPMIHPSLELGSSTCVFSQLRQGFVVLEQHLHRDRDLE